MEQVPIPQSLELGNNTGISASFDLQKVVQEKKEEGSEAVNVEKEHTCEDKCSEEEIIASLANNIKLVPIDFTLNKGDGTELFDPSLFNGVENIDDLSYTPSFCKDL
ncbi:hypothetical protein K7X08_016504 [Anisodus acutangulus]|uniref:Uncharacterized protein n=1 Tax=Anisodus acutangulus TaxID=402998 RepID=A0A9Q1LEA9_9SOLA|nr:hypothetical protein K7X08_016504 [Anisodus acutangulus]